MPNSESKTDTRSRRDHAGGSSVFITHSEFRTPHFPRYPVGMPPETEVVACPACRHLVRVPADWLGQTVQCPECRATFRAPTRGPDGLGEAVLLSSPPAPAAGPPARPRADVMLMLPAFGLMVLGFAGVAVNGWNTARYAADPAAARRDGERVLTWQDQKPPENEEERRQREEVLDRAARSLPVLVLVFAVVSALEFYGGLAILRRRHYRMAQLGCVLASLNLANGCCVPGAVVGVWGLLMLISDEGREHFVK